MQPRSVLVYFLFFQSLILLSGQMPPHLRPSTVTHSNTHPSRERGRQRGILSSRLRRALEKVPRVLGQFLHFSPPTPSQRAGAKLQLRQKGQTSAGDPHPSFQAIFSHCRSWKDFLTSHHHYRRTSCPANPHPPAQTLKG